MMRKKVLTILFAGILMNFIIIVSVPQVNATIISSWNDEAAFLSANGPLSMESFETPSSTNFPMVAGDITVSTNSAYGSWNGVNTNTSWGVTDGSQNIRVGYDDGDSLWFDFASSINVFGINIWGFGTTSGSPILTFYDGLGNSEVVLSGFLGNTQEFYGMVSDLDIVTAQFTYTGLSGDGVYYDELYYGSTAIPEPATLLLLGSGLVGLAFARRRMKK